jgi:DNA-binding NarL/FixJ family response regulator
MQQVLVKRQQQYQVLDSLAFSLRVVLPKPRSPSKAKIARTDRVLKRTRVLLSNHQALVRSGIRALLERIKEVEVREASEDQQLLSMIEEFNPHVILLDGITRGSPGLELLKQVVHEFPSTRALILAEDEDEEQAVQVLRLGAAGLIAKSATSTELEFAINTIASGGNYLSKVLEQAVAKHSETPQSFLPKLTSRQWEVLKMIAEGHGTKEIALRLNLSAKTVETHRARIKKRTNIRDVAGLVRYAVQIGLTKLDE